MHIVPFDFGVSVQVHRCAATHFVLHTLQSIDIIHLQTERSRKPVYFSHKLHEKEKHIRKINMFTWSKSTGFYTNNFFFISSLFLSSIPTKILINKRKQFFFHTNFYHGFESNMNIIKIDISSICELENSTTNQPTWVTSLLCRLGKQMSICI